MATAVPSRFAVLAIDDDDCKLKKNHKPSSNFKQQSENKNDKVKQQRVQQLQSKKVENKNSNSKNRKKRSNPEKQQWEQWKKMDTIAVEEAYQHELYQAMLLSKIAYESELDTVACSNVSPEDRTVSKKNNGSNRKPKKATMSLDEFNKLGDINQPIEQSAALGNGTSRECKQKESNAKFFDRLDKEARTEIMQNKGKDMLKLRLNRMDDDITSAQLKVEIEKRDDEIVVLKDEVSLLKQELSQVKERNKKLYQILSHGEMKDKASVLAEVAKLQEIRDELTSEVSSLHAQLEQERSKTRASIVDPTKSSKQMGTEN